MPAGCNQPGYCGAVTPEPPSSGGLPAWLKAILIVLGILMGLVVLVFGACIAIVTLGGVN